MACAILLTGAYGREANLEDWRLGLDFKIVNGPYCSNRDLKLMKEQGYDTVVLLNTTHRAISIDINEEMIHE